MVRIFKHSRKKCPECRQNIKLNVVNKKKFFSLVLKKIHSVYILNLKKVLSLIEVNLLHLLQIFLHYSVEIIKYFMV